jgi:protein-L-isoaspartate(D-aspartate) O-methyltransferase
MVDRLIAEGALWSPPLIRAFRETPRHRFLYRVFQYQRKHDRWKEIITRDPSDEELSILYSDRALITRLGCPAGAGPEVPISSSSQPSLMALMLEDFKLYPGLRVLEVGAGTGYNAALMAHVVGPQNVISAEVDREVLAEAWDHLRGFPDRQVHLQHADGREGYSGAAPYDRIIVTAATPDLELAWLEQLADRGLLLAPLSLAPGLAFVVRGTVTEGIFHGRLTRAAFFMPLRAEGETGPGDLTSLPPVGDLQTLRAPWASWFDRKRLRVNWLGFSQSLAFFGLLRGFAVHYRVLDNTRVSFGLSEHDALCWFDHQAWQVTNERGKEIGVGTWRAFLEAGGPWPTEFRVKIGPRDRLSPGRRPSFLRPGPRFWQQWELSESRDRMAWF